MDFLSIMFYVIQIVKVIVRAVDADTN